MGGRSPLSSCGRRSAPPPPPVAGFANPIFYNINIGDLPTPMFQQAPMLPIFDVRCVHRTNATFDVATGRTRCAGCKHCNMLVKADRAV